MRILIISNYYPPFELGGWEQLTRDVAGLLEQRGHQIRVLTSNYRTDEVSNPEPGIDRLLHLESPDHVGYRPQYTLLHQQWERQNVQHLIEAVSQFAPDIIFINGMWNLPVSLAQKAEALLPGRVVYYVASYWPTETDAHTAYWQDTEIGSWRQIPKKWMSKMVQATLLSSTPRNQLQFPLVLCVSAFMQEHLVQEGGIPQFQTRVVHNGIDPDDFAMRDLSNPGSNLRLLYAGRLSPDKGVHTVIEALGVLEKMRTKLGVTLSIVGSGTEVYEAQLKQSVDKLNLTEVVKFWDQVPRERMPAILTEHEALALPSMWPEPLARMTQEAMSCGLVVIGTTTGGTPEILHDGQNGLTFEAGNAKMLAEKIALVADDPELRRQLAIAARQTIEEHFTVERMVDEIEESFVSVL